MDRQRTALERYEAPLEDSIVTECGVAEASCQCLLAPHADGAHKCACGGSWEWQNGRFVVHSLPSWGRL